MFWHSEQFLYTTCSPALVSFLKRYTCIKLLFLPYVFHRQKLEQEFSPCWICNGSKGRGCKSRKLDVVQKNTKLLFNGNSESIVNKTSLELSRKRYRNSANSFLPWIVFALLCKKKNSIQGNYWKYRICLMKVVIEGMACQLPLSKNFWSFCYCTLVCT